ncbi:hypothetical protein C8F04DRAFT_1245260 [Mycena alexandri]|uniref:Uncharacterized protein n=1 Tax=Mycena alexandri TaxID=1745969 RepID=A0AAD6WL68_9AGAR|nr:hypothetical protein C8F04DRAFT_1245260 [Mycena alexandri]
MMKFDRGTLPHASMRERSFSSSIFLHAAFLIFHSALLPPFLPPPPTLHPTPTP